MCSTARNHQGQQGLSLATKTTNKTTKQLLLRFVLPPVVFYGLYFGPNVFSLSALFHLFTRSTRQEDPLADHSARPEYALVEC